MDTQLEWTERYDRIQTKLFIFMQPDARPQVTRHFEDFLDHPERYKFDRVLRHGDFGPGNIIYDPDNGSVVGILDFGGAGSGDPAIDFAGLYASFGEEFYTKCYAIYPEMEQALKRVHFYCGMFALEEALFGIENGDEVAYHNGIAKYV